MSNCTVVPNQAAERDLLDIDRLELFDCAINSLGSPVDMLWDQLGAIHRELSRLGQQEARI